MTRPRLHLTSRRLTALALLLAMPTIGAVAAMSAGSAEAFFLLLGVCLVPLVAVASWARSPLVFSFLIFAQVFEAYGYPTPFATASVGTIAALTWMLTGARETLGAVRSGVPRLVFLALLGLAGTQVFQIAHVGAGEAARVAVTLTSFILYWLIGIQAARQPHGISALALGGFAGFLVLGATGLADIYGLLTRPELLTSSISPPRSIFGFELPIARSLGLSISNWTPSSMFALAFPWMLIRLRTAAAATNALMLVGIAVMATIVVFVFQTRTMVLEGTLAFSLLTILARRSGTVGVVRFLVVLVAIILCGALGWQLTAADTISSGIRSSSYLASVQFFLNNPSVLLVGTDPTAFHATINAQTRFANLIPVSTPVHSFLIEQVARGGLLAGACVIVIVGAPIWNLGRRLLSAPEGLIAMLLSALLMVSLELMITPGIARAGSVWMVLGAAAGITGVVATRLENARVAEARPLPIRRRPVAAHVRH